MAVGRFTDMLDAADAGYEAQVEQLAGLFPTRIVQGYADGTYQPNLTVDRGTMSVYLQRALKLPTGPYQAYFSDVTDTTPFWAQIEALRTAKLVMGFADGTYQPSLAVDRGTMAVYIARALVGSTTMPTWPATATFSDVATDFWAFKEVEYCHTQGVVAGYADGTYKPADDVIRGTMALYIYRAFVQPNSCMVVLAGPATTKVDPTTVAPGVSSVTSDPSVAYVAFDAVRMAAADLTVDFAAKSGATTTALGSYTIKAADIATAAASGNPLIYATAQISGLDPGSYTLVVSVGSDEITRQPAFTVPAPPAPPAP